MQIEGRLRALAEVHALFVQSRWTGADLHTLVRRELLPYARDGERAAHVDGPRLHLEPNTAQIVAVALHELATNAAKYGALSVPGGRIHIEWSHSSPGLLVIRWAETGRPSVRPPTRKGFGTRVIEDMIRVQLKGGLRLAWRQEGLICEISIPA